MAKISKETVKHIAKLARIKLSEKEVEKFAGQLSSVFEYMEILEEVDTDGVKETAQVTGLENVMEKDEVVEWKVGGGGVTGSLPRQGGGVREELLGCAELPVESNQILVKSVIKK